MNRYNPLKEWLDQQRTASTAHRLLQLVILVAGLLAIALTQAATHAGPFGWISEIVAVAALVLAALRPESFGAALLLVALGVWWFFGGLGAPWWRAGPTGVAMLVCHQACAWAATGPRHAAMAAPMAGWMARRLGVLALAATLAVAALAAAHLLPVGYQPWLRAAAVLAVLGVVVALVLVRDQPDS